MGVVHKLTDDVIDFIVKQKQFSPAIGCRRLSAVVADQFHIHVSKSSISSVLQEAKLSSPVGRRSLPNKKTPMKFKIPEAKKKDIFSVPKSETVVKTPKISVPEKKKTPEIPEAKPIFRMRPVLVPLETAPIQEKVVQKEMSNLKSPPPTPPQRIDKAGMIFLKASQWDMAGGSLLGKVLKEEFSSISKDDCDRVGDLSFCLEYFGIAHFSTINSYKGQGLWAMNGAAPSGLSALNNLFSSAQKITDFGMKASVEAGALLQRISSFKLVTEDGTVFYVDAAQKTIAFDNVQSEKGVPLTDAVRVASEEICGHVNPIVFHYVAESEQDPTLGVITAKLTNAFNHVPGQGLKEVSLCDGNGTELAKYSYGLSKKKEFILAVWPSANWVIPQSQGNAGQLDLLNQKFIFDVQPFPVSGDGSKYSLTAITVRTSSENVPFVRLLTNCADDLDAQKKALSHFLLSWHGLSIDGKIVSTPSLSTIKSKIDLASDFLLNLGVSSSFDQGAIVLRQTLDHWAQQYYFEAAASFVDEKTMKERFYDLEGLWQENEQSLAVMFLMPAGYPHADLLKMAVARVNQQLIHDSSGRRLVLGIAPAA